MRGDILILRNEHRQAAQQLACFLLPLTAVRTDKIWVTIAGESGAGKSETAQALKEELEKTGLACIVIQQDDFFVYPPKTNAAMRVKTGGDVGPQEVRLDLLENIIQSVKQGNSLITKPLVDFDGDRILSEALDLGPYSFILIEGTYTSLLDGADFRVFIARDLHDTRADRLARNREIQDAFLEKILQKEHDIISAHQSRADFIIDRDFHVKSLLQP